MTGSGILTHVAAFGLSDRSSLVAGPLEDPAWNALLGEALDQRMEGMLAASVATAELPASEGQRESLRQVARERASMDLLVERETVRTAAILEDAGVPYRLLKGPAWAHSIYDDPSLRGFGDVDVLVESDRWDDAVRALQASGARRLFPEVRRGFDGRFGKDSTFVAPSGQEVDLHRTLVVGPYGFWIDTRELFARSPRYLTLGGHRLPVLDPDAAFLHSCYNAALGDDPPRLPALRDVAQMGMSPLVDPDETFSLADRWKATAVVRHTLRLVEEHLGIRLGRTPVGSRFAGNPSRTDRMLLASYKGAGRGYTSQLAGVVAIRGVRAKIAYLSALVHPQRSYLEARGLSPSGFLRYGLRRVRRYR